ncbi:MAG: superoxide dismutase [Alphaproteobacteria bacterium]
MTVALPDLPYKIDALAPHISAETLGFHHGKHHNAYVVKTNELIQGTPLENASLDEIMHAAHKDNNQGLFNQAAQIWNHSFYWHSMAPNGGGKPTGAIAAKIDADFGSYDEFAAQFKNAGATQFGSGWAWLVLDNGTLKVEKSLNADTPAVRDGVTPILTMDVWEHAYYLDYQNLRPKYMETFLNSLVNWEFANSNLASA